MDQVKSVITLRSSKVIEKPTLEPCEKDDELISKGKEGIEFEHCKEKTNSPPALPFPHAMTKQEEIEDEKSTENIVVDHLSKLTIDLTSDITPIDDYFLDESLLSLSSTPWFAKNINFLASGFLLAHLDNQDKRKFLSEVQNFYWDDPYLFKYCPDQIF
jgi:hypothetical protein